MGEQRGGVPDFFRVEEAARVLRIGRTAAYDLARQFLATDGATGLPVLRVGKQLRVPRRRLEELSGGPLTWPPADRSVESAGSSLSIASSRRARVRTAGQSSLPFTG